MNLRKTLRIMTLLVLALSVLALGLIAIPGANAALSVTVNPTSGPPGTTVQVSCSGFTPNGQVEASYNGTDLGTRTADANGNMDFNVTVPTGFAAGTYTFLATDLATNSVTHVSFTQTVQSSASPTASPSPTPAPTTTPTPSAPEFPSMLITLTALMAISLATLLYTRKIKQRAKT